MYSYNVHVTTIYSLYIFIFNKFQITLTLLTYIWFNLHILIK